MYASGQTPNLKLPQWVEQDFVRMEDFNLSMQILDGYVNTVNGQLADLHSDLTTRLQRTNYNVFQLLSRDYFLGSYTGAEPDAMYCCVPDSANAAGNCIGFTWSKYPIHLGLYSGSSTDISKNIYDASIEKTITLDGPFTKAEILTECHGWYSKAPPMQQLQYHEEDYTGFLCSVSLNGAEMQDAGYKASHFPSGDSSVSLREYRFKLEGNFTGETTVRLNFHCPTDRALWFYGWALILA